MYVIHGSRAIRLGTLLVTKVLEERSLGLNVLDVSTVVQDTLLLLQGDELLLVDVGETPLLGDDLERGHETSTRATSI